METLLKTSTIKIPPTKLLKRVLPFASFLCYVKQMRKAVADTNADPSNLAYLEDRLRTGRGLPQLYGTQFSSTSENNRTVWQCPVADIKNVNLRREQILMSPLEDYLEGYLKTETEQGRLDSDTPLTEMGDNYVRYYYLGDQFSLLPLDKQEGVTDAVVYTATGDYCAAIPIFCSRFSNHYHCAPAGRLRQPAR